MERNRMFIVLTALVTLKRRSREHILDAAVTDAAHNLASQTRTYVSQAWTVRLDNGGTMTIIQSVMNKGFMR